MSTPPTTVKTRICIISDTHAFEPRPGDSQFQHPYRLPLPPSDVLLHAGDLTKRGWMTEYQVTLNMLKGANAGLKLVIAGNHDLTLDEAYGGRWAGSKGEVKKKAKELWTGEEARSAGVVYLDEGVREFELGNGGKFAIYASPYSPEFCGWAFAYERHRGRYNNPDSKPLNPLNLFTPTSYQPPNPIPSYPAIDIVMTHGPPHKILDLTRTGVHAGCENLRKAIERSRPRLHCFGHIHEARGAERYDWSKGTVESISTDEGKEAKEGFSYVDISSNGEGSGAEGKKPLRFGEETLFVNAAIMDIYYRPSQAPWVVDLDLPRL